MRDIIVIAHDMRSTFNVGSLLRTADGLGVQKIYFTGYTPYPKQPGDSRLPHIYNKLDAQIHKTALGAEKTIEWEYETDIHRVMSDLKKQGYLLAALEQSETATELPSYNAPDKIALILGTEVSGIPEYILERTDRHLVIPMFGAKESFNVIQAAAMALYQLKFHS